MSKAIFGAAITAILASSASIFKNQLMSNPNPSVGAWEVTLQRKPSQVGADPDKPDCVWRGKIILYYNPLRISYVGFAEDRPEYGASCYYGVRAITHVDWAQASNTVEVLVANYPVDEKIHIKERQLPIPLTFVMEQQDGKWHSKKVEEPSSESVFVLTLRRTD